MKHVLLFSLFAAVCGSPLSAQFNWQHTGGPAGAVFWRLSNNDDYAFYTDQYYLYRTNDGTNWEKFPENAIWPLAVQGSTLVGQFYQQNSFQSGLPTTLKISYDHGETWTAVTKPFNSVVTRISICSHGIYIPASDGHSLFRSADGGLTWAPIPPPAPFNYDVWSFEDRLYVGSIDTLYRTDANGENWTNVTPPLAALEYFHGVFAHGPHLLLSTDKNRIWHSHDHGQTWSFSPASWPHAARAFTLVGSALYSSHGSTGLAKSSDYGLSWTELPTAPYNELSIYSLANAGGKVLAGTYDQGVFRWEETTQKLVEANNGLGSAAIYDLAHGGSKIWATTGNGVFAFDRQQQTWATHPFLPYNSNRLTANDSGLVFVEKYDQFFLSTDYGLTWDTMQVPGILGAGNNAQVRLIDDVIFVSDFTGWLRSADFGQTWQPLSGVVSNLLLQDIFKFNGLYFAVDYTGKFYTSADQGLSWNLHATFNGGLQHIFVTNDRIFVQVYALTGFLIYTSTDGVNWQYGQDGLPLNTSYFDGPYHHVDFFGYAGKYYFYHSHYGFYASLDTCKTWLPLEYKPYHHVTMADSLFYAGSFGGGVVQSALPDMYSVLAAGMVFKDDNANGLRDSGEKAMPDVRVSLDAPQSWHPFYMTNTKPDGSYVLGIIAGINDTLRPLVTSNYVESIQPPYRLVGNGGSNLDFGVKLTPNLNDLSVAGNYGGRPRPGFGLSLYVQYNNAGTTEPNGAVLSVKLDSHLTYLHASPSPTAVFGDSLVWSLAQLPLFSTGHVQIDAQLSATTPLGLALTSVCRVATPLADVTPNDNQAILTDRVVGAYDPNEKRVTPADGLTAAEIAAGKELLYTIQFQNTGTYSAERVRITDMIDTALYQPSLRLVSASHPVTAFRLLPGGLLEIVFDQIALPDSNANEAGSHGYITFAIQRKKAFRADYEVRNHAAIFFDFNEPITTNEVITPLKGPVVSVNDPQERQNIRLRIFPNPAHQVFTVSAEGRLSGPGWLILQNTAGQICRQHQVAELNVPISVQTNGLPDGIYLVRLLGDEQSVAGRVVVHRK